MLLLAGLAWNNAHKWVPARHAGNVWSASCGLFIAALLLWIAAGTRWASVQVACALLIGYGLQVFACNVWFIVEPWQVRPGDELCSGRLGFPLGLAGLWAATLAAQWIYLRRQHG